jgi:hypothetical protein
MTTVLLSGLSEEVVEEAREQGVRVLEGKIGAIVFNNGSAMVFSLIASSTRLT